MLNSQFFVAGDLAIDRWGRAGMVLCVRKSNMSPLAPDDATHQVVYYMLLDDGRVTGPLFHSEIRCAR